MSSSRQVSRWCLVGGFCLSMLLPGAVADERRFALLLAVPVKSVDGAPLELPNPDDIWAQYFDTVNPDVDSFAEYWHEISYGRVNVSGDVFGWVNVPWPIEPAGVSGTNVLPYNDLNASGTFDKFVGEEVVQTQQVVLIDNNGDLPGTATQVPPGVPPELDFPTRGLFDFNSLTGRAVWTPGERFRDLDGDGRYDSLLEATRDGWGAGESVEGDPEDLETSGACCIIDAEGDLGDPDGPCLDLAYQACLDANGLWMGEDTDCADSDGDDFADACAELCLADGEIVDGEYCEIDDDGEWDFPEPFEDFLVIYDVDTGRWIKLDPSAKNTNPVSRAWAEAYIRANYPGNAEALIARCGNNQYDGPDAWIETPSITNKLRQPDEAQMWVSNATTPRPEVNL